VVSRCKVDQPPEAFPSGEFDPFVDDLRRLIDFASAYHLQVALENGSYEEASARFLTSAEHLNDVFERLGLIQGDSRETNATTSVGAMRYADFGCRSSARLK
jgi:hypothetical protein